MPEPILINCIFKGNTASYNGGGTWNYHYKSPLLIHCTFFGNVAGYAGGGIYSEYYSSPTLTSSIL